MLQVKHLIFFPVFVFLCKKLMLKTGNAWNSLKQKINYVVWNISRDRGKVGRNILFMFRRQTGHYFVGLFIITKEILGGKLHFLSSDNAAMLDCFPLLILCRNFFLWFTFFSNSTLQYPFDWDLIQCERWENIAIVTHSPLSGQCFYFILPENIKKLAVFRSFLRA